MKLDVLNWEKQVVGTIEVPEEVLTYPARRHLVWEVVKGYLAGMRRGTHSTKTRSRVSGGGKKPWRQKGTGRSRHGSIRSPLWRGGATTFGPQQRSYGPKINVKAKKNALKSVLTERFSQGRLLILDSMELESNRTKDFQQRLAGLELAGVKLLLVDSHDNLNLQLATRNRRELAAVDALHVNVYQAANAQHVLLSKRAMATLMEVLTS